MVYGRTTGRVLPVGMKIFSCRKEGLGMPEGFDEAIYLIEINELVKDFLR